MFLPETINRIENDVTLETLDRGRLFMTRFPLVGLLDPRNQKLRVFINTPRVELRFLFRQAKRKRRVHPVNQSAVVWFIDLEILLQLRRHGFVDHFVDEFPRIFLARATSAKLSVYPARFVPFGSENK